MRLFMKTLSLGGELSDLVGCACLAYVPAVVHVMTAVQLRLRPHLEPLAALELEYHVRVIFSVAHYDVGVAEQLRALVD